MALLKSIELGNTGVFASYWRIAKVNAVFPYQNNGANVQITVEGWFNEDTRLLSKDPVPDYSRSYFIEVEDKTEVEGLTHAILYAKLKLLPDFIDSEDAL